jgi:hypothetical protein
MKDISEAVNMQFVGMQRKHVSAMMFQSNRDISDERSMKSRVSNLNSVLNEIQKAFCGWSDASIDVQGKTVKTDTWWNVAIILNAFYMLSMTASSFRQSSVPSGASGIDDPDVDVVLLTIEREHEVRLDSSIFRVYSRRKKK